MSTIYMCKYVYPYLLVCYDFVHSDPHIVNWPVLKIGQRFKQLVLAVSPSGSKMLQVKGVACDKRVERKQALTKIGN